jgi:hypothetical protein
MAKKAAKLDTAHRLLLRDLAMRQRLLDSAPLSVTYIIDKANYLAGIASRTTSSLFSEQLFLTHFNFLSLSRTNRSWQRQVDVQSIEENIRQVSQARMSACCSDSRQSTSSKEIDLPLTQPVCHSSSKQ